MDVNIQLSCVQCVYENQFLVAWLEKFKEGSSDTNDHNIFDKIIELLLILSSIFFFIVKIHLSPEDS